MMHTSDFDYTLPEELIAQHPIPACWCSIPPKGP